MLPITASTGSLLTAPSSHILDTVPGGEQVAWRDDGGSAEALSTHAEWSICVGVLESG